MSGIPFRMAVAVAIAASVAASGLAAKAPRRPAPRPKPAAARFEVDEFPRQVEAGTKLVFPLAAAPVTGTFELRKGPRGIQISPSAVLTWTPAKDQIGPQELNIRAVVAGEISFLRLKTEVVRHGQMLAPTGSVQTPDPVVHALGDPVRCLAYGRRERQVLVVHGTHLTVLDEEGLKVVREGPLPQLYRGLFEREGYYVGLGASSLDLLDKANLSVKKSIALGAGEGRWLAIHPHRPVSYAAVAMPPTVRGMFASKPVLEIDEQTGDVHPLPRVFGTMVAVDPAGRYLYTGFKADIFPGSRMDRDVGLDREARRTAWRHGVFDMVFCYDMRGPFVHFRGLNQSAGPNGRRLVVAPDGGAVAYVSGYGDPDRVYSIAALASGDPARKLTHFQLHAYPRDLCFHPSVPLVAGCNQESVWLYDRASGKETTDQRLPGRPAMRGVRGVRFTPGGHRLLVPYDDPQGRHVLASLALRLSAEELAAVAEHARRLASERGSKASGAGSGATLPLGQIEALASGPDRKLSTKEIAARCSDAVVLVKSEAGTGTGFVIGSGGYVLTRAGLVPPLADPVVVYRAGSGEKAKLVEARAAVARLSEEDDLALLKIEPAAALVTVRLAIGAAVESGEPVTAIGNPTLGETILRQTVTQGVVSNPRQDVEGRVLIQTSAPVNPGGDGGPLFDGRGRVIGVVLRKAHIKGVAFAVPLDRVAAMVGADRKPKETTDRQPRPGKGTGE